MEMPPGMFLEGNLLVYVGMRRQKIERFGLTRDVN